MRREQEGDTRSQSLSGCTAEFLTKADSKSQKFRRKVLLINHHHFHGNFHFLWHIIRTIHILFFLHTPTFVLGIGSVPLPSDPFPLPLGHPPSPPNLPHFPQILSYFILTISHFPLPSTLFPLLSNSFSLSTNIFPLPTISFPLPNDPLPLPSDSNFPHALFHFPDGYMDLSKDFK